MIQSTQNPKIKRARLLRRRRVRLREGLLFVEGVRLIEDALNSGCQPELLGRNVFNPHTSDHRIPDGSLPREVE